ncbi:MAG: preprotein translocase subunit YajC, partial [Candidatus Methylomirabilis sp.]
MGIAHAMGGLPGGGGPGGGFTAFIPLLLMFAVFYFLLIRPQQKKQRELRELLNSLKTGDQIVTSGGLYGTIIGFGEDNRVKVKIAENVKVDIAR